MSLNWTYFGVYAALIFLASVVIFGAIEPDYSHAINSVSSLGALAAQNTLAFNLLGLLLPGLLVAVAFYYQYVNVASCKADRAAYLLMALFGVMFAGLAFPLDLAPLPGVGFTIHHILAYSSVMPFLLASALYTYVQRKSLGKHPWVLVLPISFVTVDLLKGSGMVSGGIGQRGLLICLFSWVALVCLQNAKKT